MPHPEVDQGPVVVIREKIQILRIYLKGSVLIPLIFCHQGKLKKGFAPKHIGRLLVDQFGEKICCPFIILPFAGRNTPIVKRLVTKELLCFVFFLRKALHFGISEEFRKLGKHGVQAQWIGQIGRFQTLGSLQGLHQTRV